MKRFLSGVQPSGNSQALMNLVRLWKLTGDARYDKEAERTFKFFAGSLSQHGTSLTMMAQALAPTGALRSGGAQLASWHRHGVGVFARPEDASRNIAGEIAALDDAAALDDDIAYASRVRVDTAGTARRSSYLVVRWGYLLAIFTILALTFTIWSISEPDVALQKSSADFCAGFFAVYMFFNLLAVFLLTPAYAAGVLAAQGDAHGGGEVRRVEVVGVVLEEPVAVVD